MKKNNSVYLIGIKGVGMTALAIYYKQAGFDVTGSDVSGEFVTDELLDNAKIEYHKEFNKNNLKGGKYDSIIIGAAYDSTNSEVKEAKKRRLNVKYYSEALREISSDKKTIAVSGIHGKTTITSMLSYILEKAGLSPSYLIGSGKSNILKQSAHKGSGEYFILEADEYRKSPENNTSKFLDLSPKIAIISSIEMDHPDIFPTIEDVFNTFYKLACRIPRDGFIVLCTDYAKCNKLKQKIADRDFETYGYNTDAMWKISDEKYTSNGCEFSLIHAKQNYGPFQLKLIGKHNILNAAAAIITAIKLDIPVKTIIKYLSQFQNVKRRLEKIAEISGITILDDYAHHPTAIQMTLDAVKKMYPKSKIWCIFQPHTYSRTEKLFEKFSRSFKAADKLMLVDIYSSAREKEGNITAVNLVDEIKKYQGGVKYFSDWKKLENYIIDSVKSPAVIITIGAGDIYKLSKNIKLRLEKGK